MRPGPALAGRALSLLLRSSSSTTMIASHHPSAGQAAGGAAASSSGAAAAAAAAAARALPPPRPALLLHRIASSSSSSSPFLARTAPRSALLAHAPAGRRRPLHASAAASQAAAAAAAADAARAAAADAEAAAAAEAAASAAARAAALASLRAGPPAEADAARTQAEVLDAIVKVYTTASRPDQWSPWTNHVRRESTGTGFLIAPRLILSCAHVISDASFITLRRMGASQRFRAEVVAVGHDVDLALLTVPDEAFWETPGPIKPLRLAEGVPRLQSRVRISAYPAGGDNVCVTSGVTSRVDVTQYVHSASSFMAIQVDSPINGGASGGPCLLEDGEEEETEEDGNDGGAEEQEEDEQGGRGMEHVGASSGGAAAEGDGAEEGGASGPTTTKRRGGGNAPGEKKATKKKAGDAKVVGVAFQNIPSGDSQGYIVPMPVVHRFLDEVKRHGKYRGFCSLGIIYSTCENASLRAYLGMVAGKRPGVGVGGGGSAVAASSDGAAAAGAALAAAEQQQQQQQGGAGGAEQPDPLPVLPDAPSSDLSGVLITTVQPTSAAHGLLRPGDVLLSFDGVPLANDGTVPFRARERIFFTSLVTQKPTGSTAKVEVLRAGKKLPGPIEVPLRPLRPLVRVHAYDELPSFFVFAGLVFVPLSQPFLHEWGDNWQSSSPRRLVEKALHGLATVPGEQVVILSQVLVADVNTGYQSLTNLQVLACDGARVRGLRSLRDAILSAKGPYVVLGMEQERSLVLDLAAARAADAGVLARYRVPYSTSADLLLAAADGAGDGSEANEQVDQGGGMVGPDASAASAGEEGKGGADARALAAGCGAVASDGVLLAPAPCCPRRPAAAAAADGDGRRQGPPATTDGRVGWA